MLTGPSQTRFELFVGRKRTFAELHDALADTSEGQHAQVHPSEMNFEFIDL